jgi:hypothetical protein
VGDKCGLGPLMSFAKAHAAAAAHTVRLVFCFPSTGCCEKMVHFKLGHGIEWSSTSYYFQL